MSFVGSIALVRPKIGSGENLWLGRWNEFTECYALPCVRKPEHLGYRESLDDSLSEELPLVRGKDYIVSSVPRLHFQSPLELPGECLASWVVVQFFVVELFGSEAKSKLDADRQHRWLSQSDILESADQAEVPFDARIRTIVLQSGIFS